MDSADSQWILPLCVCVHLCTCAAHARLRLNSGSALGRALSRSCFSHVSPHIMSEHAPPDACLVGVYVNKVVKAGVCFECLFLRQRDEWKTHYTNLVDRLTLVTSQTRLLDWLSNFQQEHT